MHLGTWKSRQKVVAFKMQMKNMFGVCRYCLIVLIAKKRSFCVWHGSVKKKKQDKNEH